ncbi:hypothetical protein CL615_04030 [archaeon]|jgi:hypothetical protein|nr:hypothetical protein [archaeon]MDP6547986.1 hypothetical protein [Candidatus Woesearchaeota archaeon]|tara:strand:+ start:59003 stop:59428 length:426 start_codon:yes stop_codon:yes gene_type:complete
MVEFNSDGSIKLPNVLVQQKKDNEYKMKNGHCITIKKEMVSNQSPKKCMLHIELSERFTDDSFVANIYGQFMANSEVPSKLTKKNEREFEVEIGTCFRRCQDCNNLVRMYREFLDGNIIELKGSCTYEGFNRTFTYEDHFD